MITDAASLFLSKYGRKVQKVVGDGNCLFRCLSLVLFGVQDRHFDVRTCLVNLVNSNPSYFTNYCLPLTVCDHVRRMKNNFEWGSHVEIFAASL